MGILSDWNLESHSHSENGEIVYIKKAVGIDETLNVLE